MSEQDPDTGQFVAAEPEPVVGRAANEIAAGYEPYEPPPDPEIEAAEKAADEAIAAKIEAYQNSTPNSDIKTYTLGMPDNVSMTAEQAADLLTQARKAEAEQAAEAADNQLRAEVDELRGAKPEKQAQAELDPETMLEHPKFKEAIEKVSADAEQAHSQAERVGQQYLNGLAENVRFSVASFLNRYADFNGVPLDQVPQAFARLQQTNPQRAAEMLRDRDAIFGTMQNWGAQTAQFESAKQAKQQASIRALDAKFEESIKDVPTEKRAAIENSLVDALKGSGIPGPEVAGILEIGRSNPYVRQMLWGWASAVHELSTIKSAPAKAAAKPLPPVSRPGTANAHGGGRSASIASLEAKLATATGNSALKIAAELTRARRAANAR